MQAATIKMENSATKNDADVIKIKRSEIPQDILSARIKDEGVEEDDYDAGNDYGADEDDLDDEEGDERTGNGDKNITEDDELQQIRRRRVSHGYHLVEGKMNHGMEDYLVATRRKMDGRELELYAIVDGHSGREVAEYLQGHLFDNILNEPDFWTNTKAAFKRAYEATDNDILENVVGSRGGSTAVTAILINREKLVVANLGDSRAVLCRNGTAEPISIDHDPLKEKDQVESRGGFVSKKPGNVPRVDGQLAMTRAFGDERLKEHITAEPDIFIEMIDEDVELFILASDGLWKVMSNQDAIDCIRGLKVGQEAAEELVKKALVRDIKDDISCVVVMFE